MLIHFYIKFSSKYGETLHLNFPARDEQHPASSYPLEYLDELYWHTSIDSGMLPDQENLTFSVIFQPVDGLPQEILSNRRVDLKKVKQPVLEIIDLPVQTNLYEKVFSTAPFREIFKHQKQKSKKHSDKDPNVIFKVQVPPLGDGKVICITGSSKKLKQWNEEKPLQLTIKDNTWSIKLNLLKEQYPIEYKFGIYDVDQKKILHFEAGDNRKLLTAPDKNTISIHHAYPKLEDNKWMGAGLNIPLSSIKTEQTWGIGSFSSLHLLIDWARKAGFRLIQLLPLNDTSATLTKKDSYPYAPISVFALHPLYMNIQKLATSFGVELAIETMEKIHAANALSKLDYDLVLKLKMKTIGELYDLEKQSFKDDFAWFEFFDLNRHWLVPYAAYCFLRDKYKTADTTKWEDYSVYNEEKIQELVSPDNENYDTIALQYFIQYHLHLQLKDAKDYAHKNEVILKGDLPIGVGRCSVDTWMYPHLFHLDMQAGAPPDAFATKGQNWNFPTYNWRAMARDNYAWWRQRMEHMGTYFDAVRIDHVLGFYRIWSIPMHCIEGILGRFEPAIPIARSALHENGIYSSEDRLCRPYITDEILYALFQDKAAWVKDTFTYAGYLKQEFTTQQSVEAFFSKNPLNADTKKGLFDLIANVILLKDEDTDGYHFRINMYQTTSYRDLPGDEKHLLDILYHKYFFEIQNELWEQEGREKLGALRNCTNMLLCAEDLGMVPAMVEGMLAEMQILSLQVQRMPKTSTENFSHPKNANYLSVVTPSTHDMSTIREWWEDEKEHIQYFYNYLMAQPGEAPHNCEPGICNEILLQHLRSPAMWSVFLLQDLFSIDGKIRRKDPKEERINIPADPDHTWDYRMHITVEELLREKDFTNRIRKMIKDNGR